MSSEVVAFPVPSVALPVAGVALAVAAVVMPGTLAARKIKAMLDNSIERARREIEAERARQDDWIAAVERQRVELARELERAREVERLTEALARIRLSGPAVAVTQKPNRGKGVADWVSATVADSSVAQVQNALAEVRREIDVVQEKLVGATDFPAALLRAQVDRLTRRAKEGVAVTETEVEACRQLTLRTIGDWRTRAERSAARRLEAFRRGGELHTLALEFSRVPSDAATRTQLDMVAQKLQAELAGGTLSPGRVEELDRTLKPMFERVWAAFERAELRSSVVGQLVEMNYELLCDFSSETPNGSAIFRVPGGEILTVLLQADGRLEFELSHEGVAGQEESLGDILASFRPQEKRWCSDLHELFRRLREHGFSYELRNERQKLDEAVRVICIDLETAGNWGSKQARKTIPGQMQRKAR